MRQRHLTRAAGAAVAGGGGPDERQVRRSARLPAPRDWSSAPAPGRAVTSASAGFPTGGAAGKDKSLMDAVPDGRGA